MTRRRRGHAVVLGCYLELSMKRGSLQFARWHSCISEHVPESSFVMDHNSLDIGDDQPTSPWQKACLWLHSKHPSSGCSDWSWCSCTSLWPSSGCLVGTAYGASHTPRVLRARGSSCGIGPKIFSRLQVIAIAVARSGHQPPYWKTYLRASNLSTVTQDRRLRQRHEAVGV